MKDGRTRDALFAELAETRRMDSRLDAYVDNLKRLVDQACADEFLARPMTEAMARALQAAELIRHSTDDVVDIFFSTRLGGSAGAWGSTFGTMAIGGLKDAAKRVVARAGGAH